MDGARHLKDDVKEGMHRFGEKAEQDADRWNCPHVTGHFLSLHVYMQAAQLSKHPSTLNRESKSLLPKAKSA